MIEICTHVYAAKFPHYAKALRYHLSGPLNHPTNVQVRFTIAFNEDDIATRDVLDEFAEYNCHLYSVHRLPLPLDLLGRRHYGRDLACQNTKADLIWMADCDYVFGPGCLDALHQIWQAKQPKPGEPPAPVLMYPDRVLISKTHEIGDQQMAKAVTGKRPDVDPAEFSSTKQFRAIGGTFIMDGDFARNVGYLRGGKWLPPWPDSGEPPFASTRDDVCFRQRAGKHGEIYRIPSLPGLYRLRHSTTAVNNKDYVLASQVENEKSLPQS